MVRPKPVEPRQPKWPPSPAHEAYEQAMKLLHDKKYGTAQQALLKILEDFPNATEVGPRVHALLRVCERAIQTREAQSPSSAEELFDLAVFYHNNGQYKKALTTLSHALKKAKRRLDHIFYAMAASELSLGNADDALKHLEKAVELNRDNRFFAQNDSDFESLASNVRFQELIRPD